MREGPTLRVARGLCSGLAKDAARERKGERVRLKEHIKTIFGNLALHLPIPPEDLLTSKAACQ